MNSKGSPIEIAPVTAVEHKQRLIAYVRANLRRYAERTGRKADKHFILEMQDLLDKYDITKID